MNSWKCLNTPKCSAGFDRAPPSRGAKQMAALPAKPKSERALACVLLVLISASMVRVVTMDAPKAPDKQRYAII